MILKNLLMMFGSGFSLLVCYWGLAFLNSINPPPLKFPVQQQQQPKSQHFNPIRTPPNSFTHYLKKSR